MKVNKIKAIRTKIIIRNLTTKIKRSKFKKLKKNQIMIFLNLKYN